jgi:hypothetical protein
MTILSSKAGWEVFLLEQIAVLDGIRVMLRKGKRD